MVEKASFSDCFLSVESERLKLYSGKKEVVGESVVPSSCIPLPTSPYVHVCGVFFIAGDTRRGRHPAWIISEAAATEIGGERRGRISWSLQQSV